MSSRVLFLSREESRSRLRSSARRDVLSGPSTSASPRAASRRGFALTELLLVVLAVAALIGLVMWVQFMYITPREEGSHASTGRGKYGSLLPVYGLAVSEEQDCVAGGGQDGRLHLWRLSTGEYLYCLDHQQRGIKALAFAPGGEQLYAGLTSGDLVVWHDIFEFPLAVEVAAHAGEIFDLTVSQDGRFVATGGTDPQIRVWETGNWSLKAELAGHDDHVRCLQFTADGHQLLSGGIDGTVRLWDIERGEQLWMQSPHRGRSVDCIAIAPDGKSFLTGGRDTQIRHWDLASRQLLRTYGGHKADVKALCFSPDGTQFVSGSWDHRIGIRDLEQGEMVPMSGHCALVRRVLYFQNGRTILSSSWDGTIRMWDSLHAREIRQFEKPARPHTL